MNDWFIHEMALPNAHAALVHFPVAFVPLAAAVDLAATTAGGAREWLSRAGALLWALAAVAAGFTYWAGGQAADALAGIEPQVHAAIGRHADWGLYTLWTTAVLAAGRLALARWKPTSRAALALAGVLGLGATALVFRTADLGGTLVYRHAVAVARPAAAGGEVAGTAPAGQEQPEESGAATRLQRTADGGLEWRPASGDREAIGTILQPLAGSAPVGPAAVPAGGSGLAIRVSGRSWLVLPGTFGDVQLDAELDLTDYRGSLGLAHHVQAPERAGLLHIVAPEGGLTLMTLREEGDRDVLDRRERALPTGPIQLGVYAVGRHLRGTLAGETIVHGHQPPLPDGRVGLLLDGTGRVTIHSLTVTPLQP